MNSVTLTAEQIYAAAAAATRWRSRSLQDELIDEREDRRVPYNSR
jgi:hypothetical protein